MDVGDCFWKDKSKRGKETIECNCALWYLDAWRKKEMNTGDKRVEIRLEGGGGG